MGCACYQAEQPGGERTIISNVGRVLTQEPGCQSYQVIQATSSLQRRRSRNYRCYDQHHINGHLAGVHAEDKHEYEHTHHTVDAQSDTTNPGADKYKGQYDKQL